MKIIAQIFMQSEYVKVGDSRLCYEKSEILAGMVSSSHHGSLTQDMFTVLAGQLAAAL